MITFLIGLVILLFGGMLYGAYCDKVFGPTDKATPAMNHNDGVDFVPMKKWKNSLIQLLNIAGTGPILGPIQGILFGSIAFLLIPSGMATDLIGTPSVIGIVAKDLLGTFGGIIAIIGVIVLPITSGDTALCSLRLMVADFLHIDQKSKKNRILLSGVLFILVAGILVYE